ncbi:late competence protein ComER [Radiobacillus kanasensis]|uniref:late competence protein ComER n=1 Tax=Radiobacillus kanasensis TaxID=2844358 RepID=UPI001E2C3A11|nr:late competence protein ComER [Radiobacillus kanasensis]UFT97839.1 late competence protein ComER [Radiobacillus kanasensis]
MKWGVIGTGNMGSILINSWMSSNVVQEDHLYIHNRTLQKAYDIQKTYPDIHVSEQVEDLIDEVDIVFVCVKPLEIHPLLSKTKEHWREDQCLVSITSPFSVEKLESLVPCQVARMIPSITNRALSGITLLTFGESMSKERKGYLEQSSKIYSTPFYIEDDITRISSDIVSCGPAFFGYLAEQFIESAVAETKIDKQTATDLTEKMFVGFGKLLEDGHFTLPELIQKVCVKGGVTGEGIKAMDNELGDLFHVLIRSTHAKYDEDVSKISEQLQIRD